MAISLSDAAGGDGDIKVEGHGVVGQPGDVLDEETIASLRAAAQELQEGKVSPVDWSQFPDDGVYAEPAPIIQGYPEPSPPSKQETDRWSRQNAIEWASKNHTGYMVILAAEAFVRYIETGDTQEAAKAFPFVTLDQIGEIERELERLVRMEEEEADAVRETLIRIAAILGMDLKVKE